ncbi:MAG TPA: hypothetical protein VF331_15380 [Polyangiales bacterium]
MSRLARSTLLASLVGLVVAALSGCGARATSNSCPADYECWLAADGAAAAVPQVPACPQGYICTPHGSVHDAGNATLTPQGDAGGSSVTCPEGFACTRLDAHTPPASVPDASVPCPPGYLCRRIGASGDAGGTQTADAGSDAGGTHAADAGSDAGNDAGGTHAADAGSDAGSDAGNAPIADAGSDAQVALDASSQQSDAGLGWNGNGSGSVLAFSVLGYRVVDAEQSASQGSLAIVSDAPTNSLHIFDEATRTERSVDLPAAPVAVAVDPSGTHAAVAYDANVSRIDLVAGTVLKTCPLSSDAFDLTLSDAGKAYVIPRTDQWVAMHVVDLVNCTEVTSTSNAVRAGSHIAAHPSGNAVFTADNGLSPSRIDRCDITNSPPTCTDAQSYADWGTYAYCGNLWISADGQRIYGACGATLRVPGNVNGSACTYGGTLPGGYSIQHLAEAASAQQVAFIPNGSADDSQVRVHETAYLGYVAKLALPAFPLGGSNTTLSHGRFVFTTPTLDTLYVIVQADPAGGALHDFAVTTIAVH